MHLITVVVPCYNEEEVLPYFHQEMLKLAKEMNLVRFEWLFINDGSKDRTLNVLKNLSESDERVRFISFSRNFGKEAAMLAGLENAKGDYVVIMDADLQHPPHLIKEMYKYVAIEGYDCAATRRINRKGEPRLKSYFSKKFYKIINKISDTNIIDGAQDYRLMSRKMVDSLIEIQEVNRFSKGLFSWVGFNTRWIEIENVERVAGQTTWSFWGLFLYSLEGIMAFSTAPLAIASILGFGFCMLSAIMLVVTIAKTVFLGEAVAGYPTIICAIFLIGGIQLFCIGILGQYLAKTYLETKKRPVYLVAETEVDYMKVGLDSEHIIRTSAMLEKQIRHRDLHSRVSQKTTSL